MAEKQRDINGKEITDNLFDEKGEGALLLEQKKHLLGYQNILCGISGLASLVLLGLFIQQTKNLGLQSLTRLWSIVDLITIGLNGYIALYTYFI